MKHPISWQLVREIRENASSKEEERQAFARLRTQLDGFHSWRPYVPTDIPLGPHRPPCCCANGGGSAIDGRCSWCWGWWR